MSELPWFETGKPLRNWMLHETDFVDEVEQIWGRPLGRRGHRPAARGASSRGRPRTRSRDEYAQEWQYYYSSSAGNADLGRLQAQFDEYYAMLEANGVRVNYIEAPVPAIGAVRLPQEPRHARRRRARRPRRRDRAPHGPRLVAARPRGDLVEGADRAPGADLPHDPRHGRRRAGRWALARLEHVRLQRERGRERGGPPADRLGARGPRDRDDHRRTRPAGSTRSGTATSARPTPTCSCMVPDDHVAVLAPHLVNYGFVRYLMRNDWKVIEVPVEEYWGLAVNAVTLEPGKVVMNAGLADRRRPPRAGGDRGDPGRLLGEPPLRDRRSPLRDARARARPAGRLARPRSRLNRARRRSRPVRGDPLRAASVRRA